MDFREQGTGNREQGAGNREQGRNFRCTSRLLGNYITVEPQKIVSSGKGY
ncbi:MAG: hypothetical protein F6K26_26970 [Moorea sp. SIO2I5]|nr:hypothetical protein [Moorena sp. SIO2I5]